MENQSTFIKPYELNISVTRHGPKESMGGPLSNIGRESVLNYYRVAFQNPQNFVDKFDVPRTIISSPINRARETAQIYKLVLEEFYPHQASFVVETDERLSEQDLIGFIEQLSEEDKNEWFGAWYNSEFGKKSATNFTEWLIENINSQKDSGGDLQIEAFSHGPVMAAFILRLEELLGQNLLSNTRDGESKFSLARLFTNQQSPFEYLGKIYVQASSQKPDLLTLKIQNKIVDIPFLTLRNI